MEFLDSVDEFLLNASQHEFVLMVVGVVLYFSVIYSIEKDKFNAKDDPFRFIAWLRRSSDNIWVALLVGCLCIVFDDEILILIHDETPIDFDGKLHSVIYLGGGPFSDLLRRAVKKFTKH